MGSFLDVWPIAKPFCRCDSYFIETGTYKGEGLAAVMDEVSCIAYWSIEANKDFAIQAEAFLANSREVSERWRVFHGDSVKEISKRVANAGDRQAIFFLDAHFPGHYGYEGATEFPLLSEVHHIVNNGRDYTRDVIVIDDLLLFEGVLTEVPFAKQEGLHQLTIAHLFDIETMLFPTHHVMRVMNGGGHLVALPKVNPND